MKKILLIALLFVPMVCLAQNSQYFTLQSDGTYKANDGKDFIVIQKDGKTASQLYNEVLVNVTKAYNSPKDVISKVENSIISINGVKNDCISMKAFGNTLIYSMQYIIQFQFKDEKLRINAPIVKIFARGAEDISLGWWLNQWIFKKGVLIEKRKYTYDQFNQTTNDIITNIVSPKSDNW